MNFEREEVIIMAIFLMSKLRLKELQNPPRLFSSQVRDRA